MALLGPQLVFTIVMTTLLQKIIIPYHSLALWLIGRGNLYFYSYPSDQDLKKAAGIAPNKGKRKRNRLENLKMQLGLEDTFTVPKNINLELTTKPVHLVHLLLLEYLSEFRWLVDFSCVALTVYTITELYYAVIDVGSELNLSLIWLVMMVGFVVHTLFHLTALYFQTEDAGERSVCVTFSFFFLVIAMATLVVDEDILEFGLEDAHDEFLEGATAFLKEKTMESDGPMSLITFKVILTIVATVIGGILTFPGLRYAKMYIDAQKHYCEKRFIIFGLHISFLFPLFISLMWVKPVARTYFKSPNLGEGFDDKSEPLMSDETFDLIRFCLIPIFCLLRFCLTTVHLQSHLNMAKERFDSMKMEAGRINSLELQKMIIRVFSYLCVVALQYVAPLLLLMSVSCLLKTSSGISFRIFDNVQLYSFNSTRSSTTPSNSSTNDAVDAFRQATEQFTVTLDALRKVFCPMFFQGIYSFLTWWICTSWFISSLFGVLYHTYLTR